MKKKILAIFTLIITICSIFALTACNTGTPAGNGDGDFNFKPITSEKITAEEWAKAFDIRNGKNYTVVFDIDVKNDYLNAKMKGKEIRDNDVFYEYEFMKDQSRGSASQTSYVYKENDIWYRADKIEGTGMEAQTTVRPTESIGQEGSQMAGLDMTVLMWLSMAADINQDTTLYSENFEKAKYDESTKQYIITEVGTDKNGAKRTIVSKIVFKNKKIAQAFVSVDGKEIIRLNATFGGTKISIPDWAMKK